MRSARMADSSSVRAPDHGCKGFALVKRPLLTLAIVAGLLVPATAVRASNTTTGGAQIQWTTTATATMAIATQYSAAFAQGTATPTLLPSVAGICAGSGSETAFTLTFGALNPIKASPSACLYKNALAVSVSTNDATGFSLTQYLDTTPTTGVGICAFPNGGAAFPLAPAIAPVATSGRSGNPAAGTYTGNALTSCAAGGSVVPPGTGGSASAGTVPGNPGTPGLQFYSPSGSGVTFLNSAGATQSGGAIVTMYGGEDVQVNLAAGAPSTLAGQTGVFLTLQLIVN